MAEANTKSWWLRHEAYDAIINSLYGCNNKPSLAYMLLTGLDRQGFKIVREDEGN